MKRMMVRWMLLAVVALAGGCLQIIGFEDGHLGWVPCTDGYRDGNETDVDCGGSCTPCAMGKSCEVGGDCESHVCTGGTCRASTCMDAIQNGEETDVDCGGPMCTPCVFGKGCKVAGDCLTGFCDAQGRCDAQTIMGGLDTPNSLVVDGLNVYWADGDLGVVMMADIATGTAIPVAIGEDGPQGLIGTPGNPTDTNPTYLFWMEPATGRIDQVTIASMPELVPSPVTGANPHGLAGGFAELVWTNDGTPNGSLDTPEIPNNTPEILDPLEGEPDKIASFAATTIVFSMNVPLSGWSLWTVSFGFNQTPTMLATTNSSVAGLATDGTSAYWTDGAMAGSVAKVPLAGGQPTVIAPEQASPADVAVDALYVYWIDQGASPGTGAVMQAPLSGGTPVVLASGQDAPRGLFLTATDVYWISGAKGQGAVKKIPK